jgi:hypothetical protein
MNKCLTTKWLRNLETIERVWKSFGESKVSETVYFFSVCKKILTTLFLAGVNECVSFLSFL